MASVVVLGCWLLFASRRTALLPMMILMCFIPSAQRVVIAGADFTLLRIMVLFGLARILARGELTDIRLNRIDCVYTAWVFVGSLVYVLQKQDFEVLVNVSGKSMDMIGAYLLARIFIRTADNLRTFTGIAAILAIPVSLFFLLEYATGRNLFSLFGGVPEMTNVREGRLRCQGAFAHPITAGCFWAAISALLIGAGLGAKQRMLYVIGFVSCLLIIVASASSTPMLGLAAAVVFWACWPIRHWMRYAVMAVPPVLFALHLVMKAPVWHLVSRVSAVGGSTGYHRYALIDGAIRHFDEWWLVGSTSTAHWSEYGLTWDITNQYILEGVKGGIWRLGLFLLLIFLVARAIGRAQRRAANRSDEMLLYGLNASLFVHCVCFIGVSYFGQIEYLLYMTLAIGSSAGAPGFSPASSLITDDVELGGYRFVDSEGATLAAVKLVDG